MDLTPKLSDSLTMISLLSMIGYRDDEILEVVKEEELTEAEIDFLFDKNQEVKKWQKELQSDISLIINQEHEQDDEKLILGLLKNRGVDPSIEELVMGSSVMYEAVNELREPVTQMIKSGASQEETIESFKKQDVEGDYIPLLYQKISSEIPAAEIENKKGYPAWILIIGGFFWIFIGRALTDGDDSFTIIGYGFVIFGLLAIGRGLQKIIKSKP